MDLPKALIGGGIGALAGLVVWAVIGFAVGNDLGILAIALGAAVGFGIRIFTKGDQDLGYGVVAVLITIGAVVICKYIVAELVTQRGVMSAGSQAVTFTDDDMIAREANVLASQKVRTGKPMNWPSGKSLSTAKAPADYPPDILQQATADWNSKTDKDARRKEAETAEMSVKTGMVRAQRQNAISESFSLLNLLWILLALGAAFALGFGSKPKEDDEDDFGMIDDGSGLIRAKDA
jgi:hypothetical protein